MAHPAQKMILVVDDEKDILDPLASYLERNGFHVLKAADGKTARYLIKEYQPHLVILDIMLPDADGTDIASEMETLPATRNIPVIFLTSMMTKEEQARSGQFIANRCIVAKPCNTQEILELINRHLAASS